MCWGNCTQSFIISIECSLVVASRDTQTQTAQITSSSTHPTCHYGYTIYHFIALGRQLDNSIEIRHKTTSTLSRYLYHLLI